jgi:hypothetical protein
MSTNNWTELSLEQKITVLYWAKEGLLRQTAGAVGHCAQHAMIRDMQDKAPFDPTEFYDRINPRNRSHWDHVEKYVEVIDQEIFQIEQELAADNPPDTADEAFSSPSPDSPDAGTPDAGTDKQVIIPQKKAKKKAKKKNRNKVTPKYPTPKGGCGNGGK